MRRGGEPAGSFATTPPMLTASGIGLPVVSAHVERAHRLGDAVTEFRVLIGVGLGSDHRELIAAVADDKIGRSGRRAQRVGHRLQRLVAFGVSELVVDGLEPVHVHQHDGEGVTVPCRPGGPLRQVRLQGTPVVESGEHVVRGVHGKTQVVAPRSRQRSREQSGE